MFATVLALIPCLLAPVPLSATTSVEPFRPPACAWCPGHRGVEYSLVAATPVVAPVTGRVAFSGTVAGVRYVVIDVGGPELVGGSDESPLWKVTLGGLRLTSVSVGEIVPAGRIVGASGVTLFLSVRRDGLYVDPASLFGRWRARAHLVPLGGGPRRAFPVALDCAASRGP